MYMPSSTYAHTTNTPHTQGSSERCHLCEERSVFLQTLSGSEFAFSVECKSGWIKQHLASSDGLSLHICVCICVQLGVCVRLDGDDARRRPDWMQADPQTVLHPCQDPSLFLLASLNVSFHCFLARHLSRCFPLCCVAHSAHLLRFILQDCSYESTTLCFSVLSDEKPRNKIMKKWLPRA